MGITTRCCWFNNWSKRKKWENERKEMDWTVGRFDLVWSWRAFDGQSGWIESISEGKCVVKTPETGDNVRLSTENELKRVETSWNELKRAETSWNDDIYTRFSRCCSFAYRFAGQRWHGAKVNLHINSIDWFRIIISSGCKCLGGRVATA